MKTIEWATGLFEGEGTIVKDKRRPGSYQLSLHMCDEDVVSEFQAVMKYGNVNDLHPPCHKEKG